MKSAYAALAGACLLVWGGVWSYLWALQKRVDRLEDGASED